MKLKSKFIYAKTLSAFEDALSDTKDEIDKLSPIAFIEETRQIWINKTFFSIGSPNVVVSEKDSIIDVDIGDGGFKMSTSGSNLTIRKGTGNNIIFSSSALNSINTETPLEWDNAEKKLTHKVSGVSAGNYGETSSSDNVSLVTVPWFSINKWGHITEVIDRNIKIRDYVEQIPSSGVQGNYNILIGNNPNEISDTNITRKALGLTYDPHLQKLSIEGGILAGTSKISGDLTVEGGKIFGIVEGEITGSATPKIHISDKPEYGGASTELYGHVKVQDTLNTPPPPSSDNIDPSSPNIHQGIAASPKMVWDVREELQGGIDALPVIEDVKVNEDTVPFKEFKGVLGIQTEGGLSGGIDVETHSIVLGTVAISGYTETNEKVNIKSSLEFTDDFEYKGNKLSIRWQEI